ncbi:MAG: hypothetical protein J6K61_01370 [Clostridia bacterium]|nr:hypothetical protein [Clostridia bacterium]
MKKKLLAFLVVALVLSSCLFAFASCNANLDVDEKMPENGDGSSIVVTPGLGSDEDPEKSQEENGWFLDWLF